MGQYALNLNVLGLNYSSTFAEMIKGYRSMACRFHPDNNYGFDTTETMTTINTAKEGLQDQLRKNDAVREEERDLAAKYVESIPSDHNSDSESSGKSSKRTSPSSKESTLPAKHTDDNEETPLKNHILEHGHQKRSFRYNQEVKKNKEYIIEFRNKIHTRRHMIYCRIIIITQPFVCY